MLNNLKENSQIRDQSRSMANCSPKVCFIIHIFRNKMSHQLLKKSRKHAWFFWFGYRGSLACCAPIIQMLLNEEVAVILPLQCLHTAV